MSNPARVQGLIGKTLLHFRSFQACGDRAQVEISFINVTLRTQSPCKSLNCLVNAPLAASKIPPKRSMESYSSGSRQFPQIPVFGFVKLSLLLLELPKPEFDSRRGFGAFSEGGLEYSFRFSESPQLYQL